MGVGVTIKINPEDIKRISQNMKKRADSVKRTLQRELPTYLEQIQTTARNIIKREAYETGRLYNSIVVYWNEKSMSGNVKSDERIAKNQKGQSYGEYVEFGHFVIPYGNKKLAPKWVPGIYFMRRALAYNRKYRNIVIAKIKDSFKHYDAGGKWFKTGTSATLGLNGESMQKKFSPTSVATKALRTLRRYNRKRTTKKVNSRYDKKRR